MRSINRIFLLSAGILLSLVGCQKGNENETTEGKLVQFGVSSGMPRTRTEYSGEGKEEGGKLVWERIDWKKTDKLLIWSDKAVVKGEPDNHSSVYGLNESSITVANENKESHAYLEKLDDKGLLFPDDVAGPYVFWGMYPENAYLGDSKPIDGAVSFKIEDEQTGTKDAQAEGTVLKPDMSKAIMFAYASVPDVEVVELKFKPAYTAFEFHLVFEDYNPSANNPKPITLQKVELTSEKSNLAGIVAATVGSETTYAIAEDTTPSKMITFNFPSGTQLSANNPVTFTVFALPNLIEDLRVSFYYTDSSSSHADIRSGVLSYNKEPIPFAACLKHKLTGIFVRENYDTDGLKFTLKPTWDKEEVNNGSNGDYPQTTQFVVGPSTVVQNAWDDRLKTPTESSTTMTQEEKDKIKSASRQTWEFLTDGSATVNYSIMLPKVGSWRVEVCGDTDAFTVIPTSGTLAGVNEGSTKIALTITPTKTGNGKIYLKTYVTPQGGNEFNIDSETQLYDIRGYHYFVYNTSHEYTSNYVE